MSRPIAIDLFTGLHGWATGLTAVGWRVIGFDLEDMCSQFGVPRPDHVQLVIQDVLTLHGSQFRDAALIVASPPCQAFSYMAMPWSCAKAKAAAIRADRTGTMLADLTRLFDACFSIQKEACAAAGHHIPMVVENVRGAIPWVGRSRGHYGSYHLWGDVPALMPVTKARGLSDAVKRTGTTPAEHEGTKGFGDFDASWIRQYGSKSPARKAASAMIAKIPWNLAEYIGKTFWPETLAGTGWNRICPQ